MTSKETKPHGEVKVNEYPNLKIHEDTNGKTIVLFIKNKCGSIIYTTKKHRKLGEYSMNWDEANFTDYTGEITLSN